MSEICRGEDKEEAECGGRHPKEESGEGAEAESLNDNAAERSVAAVRHTRADGVDKDEPGLGILESFDNLVLLPFIGLEAMCILLWAEVSIVALIRTEKSCAQGGIWKEDKKDDPPEKCNKSEYDEQPPPGGNLGLDMADGICE
jgi:hypothetical protein